MAKILITGGTGSIGKHLIECLIGAGHQPVVLSRSVGKNSGYETFKWDPAKGYIDEKAFEGIEHIINLAGNGIAEKRWTKSRKAEIIESRIAGTKVLYTYLQKLSIRPVSFIGASAIGYYGMQTSEKIFSETDAPSHDFLGKVCKLWEESYDPFKKLGINTSIIRIGVVLARTGGIYSKLLGPIKRNLGVILGSGKQYMPWIHVDDLVKIILELISSKIPAGIYNAVASQHINNAFFTKTFAATLNKTIFLPKAPAFVLKVALGEMSSMLLGGSRASNQKLIQVGFKFKYEDLEKALSDLGDNQKL